jgi:hypothetical protein
MNGADFRKLPRRNIQAEPLKADEMLICEACIVDGVVVPESSKATKRVVYHNYVIYHNAKTDDQAIRWLHANLTALSGWQEKHQS